MHACDIGISRWGGCTGDDPCVTQLWPAPPRRAGLVGFAACEADLSKVTTPALFCFNPQDQVVHPDNIRATIARWGAATDTIVLEKTAGDDEMGHIVAGDIFSPNQTAPLAQRILAWLAGLPPR